MNKNTYKVIENCNAIVMKIEGGGWLISFDLDSDSQIQVKYGEHQTNLIMHDIACWINDGQLPDRE